MGISKKQKHIKKICACGSRIRLEVHHIISLAEDISIAFDSNNLTTLCHSCHLATDNFGTKVVHKLKNQGGK